MVDFHSHILPEIDDGAQSVEESLEMLRMLREQGVKTVCLTPHYLAMDESPDEFLKMRDESFNKLKAAMDESGEEFPQLLLGAEVFYYPGICRTEDFEKLKLQGTDLLLLEMPSCKWSEYTLKELEEPYYNLGIRLVIAHIERYIDFQPKDILERLFNCGATTQVNASFFISKRTKRKALKMFKLSQIGFIGSDCHNVKYRPPRMDEALQIIRSYKKIPEDFINSEIRNMENEIHNSF